jgi:tetratricopeptide (TPR) repeat protein
MRPATPSRGRAPVAAWAAVALALSLGSCSSAPKPPEGVYEARNKAAELAKMGDGYMAKAQYADALKFYEDALKATQGVDDLDGVAASRASIGRAYLAAGESEAARGEFQASLEYASFAASARAQSIAKAGLGEVAFAMGAKEEALAAFEEALALATAGEKAAARGAKDGKALAVALHDAAVAKAALGRGAEAIADLERAQALNLKAKRWVELGANRYALASALMGSGRLEEALAAALGALDADRKAENSRSIPGDLAAAAGLSSKLGRDANAWDYWRRSFDSALAADDALGARKALTALVELAPKLARDAEGTRYASLLSSLDKAEERARTGTTEN